MPEKTVLVVDDDPDVHELLRKMLRGEWNCESTQTGEEALLRLRNRSYDVILTDVLMPGMGGLNLLEKILETRPESKVVVMTVQNRPDWVAESMRAMAAGYLAKPFTKDQLIDTLEGARESQASPEDIEVLSAKANWVAVKARCKLDVAERLVRFFREIPAEMNADQRDAAALAFRELLINAIEHGGKLDPEKKVELHFIRTSTSLLYYVRDPGEGFSFENLEHAAISHPDDPTEHIKVRQEKGIRAGGFGMLLLNNFADELIYNSKGNEVILFKKL